jgi:hypothetical protein
MHVISFAVTAFEFFRFQPENRSVSVVLNVFFIDGAGSEINREQECQQQPQKQNG